MGDSCAHDISNRINQKFRLESWKSTAASELFQLNNSVDVSQRVGEREELCVRDFHTASFSQVIYTF
jgi:hypothetical protein